MKRRDVGSQERLASRLAERLVEFIEFFDDSLGDDYVRNSILRDLGATPVAGDAAAQWQLPKSDLEGIQAYRTLGEAHLDIQAWAQLMDDVVRLFDAWSLLIEAVAEDEFEAGALVAAVFDQLATNYVRLRYPRLYWFGQPFGFLSSLIAEHSRASLFGPDGPELGSFGQLDELVFETENDMGTASLFTLLPLAGLLAFRGSEQPVLLGLDLPSQTVTPNADQVLRRTLSFALRGTKTEESGAATLSVSVTLIWVPAEHGGPGLYIALGGAESLTMALSDRWRMTLELGTDGGIAGLIASNGGLEGPEAGRAAITIEAVDESPFDQRMVVPDSTGSRLEFAHLTVTGELSPDRVGFVARIRDAALILEPTGPFLRRILPEGETRIDFSLGIGLDVQRGLHIEGGTGLATTIRVGRRLGPIEIHRVFLAAGNPPGKKGSRFEASAALAGHLGPFDVAVDRLGVAFDLTRSDGDGPDVPTAGFGVKAPSGVGLGLDWNGLTGAGYLVFEPDHDRYAGIMQLRYGKLAFTAIGLIADRTPDDPSGFSLLLIVSAQGFTPIELGFGFRITGLGGIVGYNRACSVEALRSGLGSGSLDAVLFPQNPLRDAPRLISNLRSIFPVRDGQFVAGLTGIIEWGARSMLTLDVGLIIEAPSPTRLVLLGQLRARFPQPGDAAAVRINVDFVGEIDFDAGRIALDATLRDSKLFKKFSLSGDAAMRLQYKGSRSFALSLGGFHPDFERPAGFPALKPLKVDLAKRKNLKVRLSGYLALTSATVQCGAQIDLFVKVGGFSVEGFIGFDTLFDWVTCEFSAGLRGGVTVRYRGRTLFGVYLEATLTGPSDLRVRGKAKFKIWRFSYSKSFNKSLSGSEPNQVSATDPLPALVEALSRTDNWVEVKPDTSTVALAPSPTNVRLLHPDATLEIRQSAVPLNREISLYAGARPAEVRRYSIEDITVGTATPAFSAVTDFFAAGQFADLSGEERLARPSFELMDAGVRLSGGDRVRFGGDDDESLMVAVTAQYETKINGVEEKVDPLPPLDPNDLIYVLTYSAIGQSRLGANTILSSTHDPPVGIAEGPMSNREPFAIATKDNLTAIQTNLQYGAAVDALRHLSDEGPDGPGGTSQVQIVRMSELATAGESS